MMYKIGVRLALAGILVFTPLATSAQVRPPPGGQRQRLELERRLQSGFQQRIQTELGLDQEKMLEIRQVMQSFQEERQALNRAQASLRYRLRDPGLPDLEEPGAVAILQEMVEVQENELNLYRREQEELLKIMTPVQLVRFYRLREELGLRVQQLREGRGQGMGGPPGGVGGRGGVGGILR